MLTPEAEDLSAYTVDWRNRYHGKPLAVLRPADTAQVAATVALCAQHGVAVVRDWHRYAQSAASGVASGLALGMAADMAEQHTQGAAAI